jgi:hypothetical protein
MKIPVIPPSLKLWRTSLVLCSLASAAHAQLTVYDPINHATAVTNEVVNFAKWTSTELHAAATELNTLNTYEQEALAVARMGDPRTLTANLPGIQNIVTLSQIYAQVEKDYVDISAYANPQSWKLTAQAIMNTYQQPSLAPFAAKPGAQPLIQFSVSNYNSSANTLQSVQALQAKLKTLTDQLSAATTSLQAATTQSAVQKYQGIIEGLHASIDATNGAITLAKFQNELQTLQNNSAAHISQVAQTAAVVNSDQATISQGLTGLPVGQMSTPISWGGPQ